MSGKWNRICKKKYHERAIETRRIGEVEVSQKYIQKHLWSYNSVMGGGCGLVLAVGIGVDAA